MRENRPADVPIERVVAKALRPGDRARVVAGRELEALRQLADAPRRTERELRVGLGLEAHAFEDLAIGEPLQVVAGADAKAVDGRDRGRRLEQRNRRKADRLEGPLVKDRV